jgi:hypothetical protein
MSERTNPTGQRNATATMLVRSEGRLAVRAESIDVQARTVEAIIATPTANVVRYDYELDARVPEILVAEGMETRGGRVQVPLLSAHDSYNNGSVLGRATNFRIENIDGQSVNVATLYFDDDDDSLAIFRKIESGSLTDVSVGYESVAATRLSDGASETFGAMTVEGPAVVLSAWELREVSVVPIGADTGSTIRGEETERIDVQEDEEMARNRTGVGSGGARSADGGATPGPATNQTTNNQPAAPAAPAAPATPTTAPVVDVDAIRAQERADERARIAEIRAAGRALSIDDAEIESALDSDDSADAIRARWVENFGTRNAPVAATANRVDVTRDAGEHFARAAELGLSIRMGGRIPEGESRDVAGHARELGRVGLAQLASMCLSNAGDPAASRLAWMGPEEVFQRAFESRDGGRYSSERAHTSSDFPVLLANSMNKRLQDAYTEERVTYPMLSRAVPRNDFKALSVGRLSEAPELRVVNEGGEIAGGSLFEQGESYSIKTFARKLTVTRQMLINDDLGAFSRLATMYGSAARRTLNRQFWALIKKNPTMSDGTALFASGHGNLAASGAVPSETTFSAMFTAMGTQTGLQSEGETPASLNIEPRYVAIPHQLRPTVTKLLGSIQPATVSNVIPDYIMGLTPLVDNELTQAATYNNEAVSGSNAAWYGFADPNTVDGIELGLLNGRDAPTLYETENAGDILGMSLVAYIDFGFAAIDWRAVYKNAGE